MIDSRQNPESARRTIGTVGHFARICKRIRVNSSSEPAQASMLEGRSRAHNRNSPAKM